MADPSSIRNSTRDMVVFGGSSRDLRCKPPASYLSRSYSASYAYSHEQQQQQQKQPKGGAGSSSFRWSLSDPEVQRKRRVATYKAYSVRGKMRDSLRKSFRWVKGKYADLLYGLW